MTERVPRSAIERLVGARRDPEVHLARAVSAERRVYILHSQECVEEYEDLRDCPYSRALDNGIDTADAWALKLDTPTPVAVRGERLVPLFLKSWGAMYG